MSMKLRKMLIASVCIALVAAPLPAAAQFGFGSIVYDPTAVTQLINQFNQQVQMLNNLVTQVQQGQAMLNPLGSNIIPGLSSLMQNTQQLMTNLNNISQTGASLQNALASQYPTDFSSIQSVSALLSKLQAMQSQTRSALEQSAAMQNQIAGNQSQISSAVSSAVTASNGASGPTATLQATNQILATLSQQIGDLQSILIAHMRAEEASRLNGQAVQNSATAGNAAFVGPDVTSPGIAITNY
jgi:P-type conjugative transfer protein TrbJ